ncbi:hypothetical protein FQN54_000128 [Arachnomyces sp. PD_36]|nr:hypothetical protein FQN54_000128 [Arachnomyces sp. PD_36]
MKLFSLFAVAALALQTTALAVGKRPDSFTVIEHPDPEKRELLQDIVSWDGKSLLINGERIMIFSAEFHPWRLPVPTLWIDVFQKIKALGFNCVSFYVDWNLLEGKPGEYTAEGIFAWEPFFEAATEAGVYLIARPGPYINAEASGGGFPGWLQRVQGTLRANDEDYLAATDNYIANIAGLISKYQITEGGPVILYQPENEYTGACCGEVFPDGEYFQYVIDQARNAGIVVPVISNDASPDGHNAPGTGVGEVDIYGHDNYPLGFDCANPSVWPEGNLPTDWYETHMDQSPNTPYSLLEFQAGAFDPWGGYGFDMCYGLVNHEFARVFYKNDFSFGVGILNLYMTFGGTNWGNLGHPGGYTSYDYGSPLAEDRNVTREKYSEIKLIANFMKVSSPAYLDTTPGNLSSTVYTSTTDLTVTPLYGNTSDSSFYILRHSDYSSQDSTDYRLNLSTSTGDITVPQLGGSLTLNGRDSKIHVTDYDVAGTNILYSTAEIFTWKQFEDEKVLIVYGGMGEQHELAVSEAEQAVLAEGPIADFTTDTVGDAVVINWQTSTERRIVKFGDLTVIIIDRNSAYNYWVPELPVEGTTPGLPSEANTAASLIVKAGYLVRTAFTDGTDLHITADFNATTPIEIIGAAAGLDSLFINGELVEYNVDKNGIWSTLINYAIPEFELPVLDDLEWTYVDSLPEIQPDYDDSLWVNADHDFSNNTKRPFTTPTSLYASDYGFHTGYILYRGHFTAKDSESTLSLQLQGGSAFGSSAWFGDAYIGSFVGNADSMEGKAVYKLPELIPGEDYVFTILIDNMGLDENWIVGEDEAKNPRGILNYTLTNHSVEDITWKITGNLGGEDYVDKVRGPLNEGGLFAERQGWHQPAPPSEGWEVAHPVADGISGAGVGFFSTSFDLNVPDGWDWPIYFTFGSEEPSNYRVQLYVNGYQYGKYVSNVGPQTSFPVPQGILDYQGTNYIAVSLWALQPDGAKIESLVLEQRSPVITALRGIEVVGMPGYEEREGAY